MIRSGSLTPGEAARVGRDEWVFHVARAGEAGAGAAVADCGSVAQLPSLKGFCAPDAHTASAAETPGVRVLLLPAPPSPTKAAPGRRRGAWLGGSGGTAGRDSSR
jgi:hypothetical protein